MNAPESERLLPDDPRLTAYALGEMEAVEQEAFERILQGNAEARAAVEEIRATVAALNRALEAEPLPAAAPIDVAAARAESRRARAKVLRFPQAYFAAAGLAAACFGVYFVVHEVQERQRELERDAAVRHFAAQEASRAAPAPTAVPQMDMALPPPAPAAAPRMKARSTFQLVANEPGRPDQFFSTAEARSSTFPLRVGRESWARVREQLQRGVRPARETVHVAEMINAFNYTWPAPGAGEAFVALLEDTAAPWAPGHRLVRVGLRGVGAAGQVAAREAQVRVDFNPERVRAWRLVGFERDDATLTVRGGPEGETVRPGDTVTALYEILPAEGGVKPGDALLTMELNFRDAASGEERQVTRRLEASGGTFARASDDLKFMAAVAAFGLALRDSPLQAPVEFDEIAAWAAAGAGSDRERLEFLELMRRTPR